MSSFSRRHGYAGQPVPISVREDAPEALRHAVLHIAAESGVRRADVQRALMCRVLRKLPNRDNWSEPNVMGEVENLIETCEWYRVYDVMEAFYSLVLQSGESGTRDHEGAREFEAQCNEVLFEQGIGWKMERGQIIYRGDQPFEVAIATARQSLRHTGRTTATSEVTEALKDLSRRPVPDRTGAIQHSMAALECVARDISGDPKETLGKILKLHGAKLAIPSPLDVAVDKAWGYASGFGRHIQEGREPSAEEAELVATVCAAVVTYLVKKHGA